MANLPFMQLPAVEAPRSALLDFAPLAQAFRDYNKGAQLAARGEQDRAIGQTAASQGYGAAGKQALNMGRLDEGNQFSQAGQAQQDRLTKRYGMLAQQIDTVQDPQQRARMWAGTLERMKRDAQAMGVQGDLDPEELDPIQGPKLFMAQAGIFNDPIEREYKRAQIEKVRRDAASGGEQPSNVREWQYYQSLSPEQRQQYLTMKRAEKWLDTGTEFTSPVPGNPTAPPRAIPKNVAEEQRQKQFGEAGGKAAADLPRALAAGDRMLEQIQGVLNDPNLQNVTGWQGFFPTFNPRNVDTEERIAQLGGGAFLQAFESLKGGGQITEIEGKKATDALARLTNLRQSDSGFLQALKDFQAEVVRLQALAKQRAGGGQAATPAAPANGGWSMQRVD